MRGPHLQVKLELLVYTNVFTIFLGCGLRGSSQVLLCEGVSPSFTSIGQLQKQGDQPRAIFMIALIFCVGLSDSSLSSSARRGPSNGVHCEVG